MKIWITRDSAGSIMAGGLGRIRVWFTKPVWVESKIWNPGDTPFDTDDGRTGFYQQARWEVRQSGECERQPVSFGNIFGYGESSDTDNNALALFVWQEVLKHFNGAKNLTDFIELEKEGRANVKDFFLELDISVKMNS